VVLITNHRVIIWYLNSPSGSHHQSQVHHLILKQPQWLTKICLGLGYGMLASQRLSSLEEGLTKLCLGYGMLASQGLGYGMLASQGLPSLSIRRWPCDFWYLNSPSGYQQSQGHHLILKQPQRFSSPAPGSSSDTKTAPAVLITSHRVIIWYLNIPSGSYHQSQVHHLDDGPVTGDNHWGC
jgi:hypothetical protein